MKKIFYIFSTIFISQNAFAGCSSLKQITIPTVKRNLITSYAHLSKIYVHEGEIITRGQPIAEVGSSGKVTKSQLYFEIRQDNEALDPIPYLDS